jgi:hypothetical protein
LSKADVAVGEKGAEVSPRRRKLGLGGSSLAFFPREGQRSRGWKAPWVRSVEPRFRERSSAWRPFSGVLRRAARPVGLLYEEVSA